MVTYPSRLIQFECPKAGNETSEGEGMDWAQGYVTDLHYLTSFHNALAPDHLRCVQLMSGYRPLPADRPFRCLELGAGSGVGLSIIAAANPPSEFVAVDYNPGHIASGRAFVERAGLTNITLLEADFADLAETGSKALGQFDYIICHGVYSWITPQLRQCVIRVLDQCAAPGALVFFGYNSLPGWTLVQPFQRLISAFAAQAEGRSDERLKTALAKVKGLAQSNAKFIDFDALPSTLRPNFDEIENTSASELRYLAHEYVSENWTPMFHLDVARDLAAAKLTFVGPVSLTDHFPELVATEEQRALLQQFSPGPLREQVKDYFSPQMYRRDVYARGATPISDHERSERLREIHLCLNQPVEKVSYEISVRIGKVTVPEKNYRPVVEFLSDGSASIGAICAHLATCNIELSPEEVFGVMVGSGQATPLIRPAAETDADLLKFNRAIAEFALTDLSARHLAIAGRCIGNGLPLSRTEFVLYDLLAAMDEPKITPDLAEQLRTALHTHGERVVEGDKVVEDEARETEILRTHLNDDGDAKIKYWKQLGAI